MSIVETEAIIRNKICRICTSRTVDGECGLEEPSSCALFRLFPEVARAVESVKSDDIQAYIDAIRAGVCSVCSDQANDGSCETRELVQCALDAYLVPIVEAIEEATGKSFGRGQIGAGSGAPVQIGQDENYRGPLPAIVPAQGINFRRTVFPNTSI